MLSLGARLAVHVRIGDVIALEGGLGAGKTTLARGLLAGLGLAKGFVGDFLHLGELLVELFLDRRGKLFDRHGRALRVSFGIADIAADAGFVFGHHAHAGTQTAGQARQDEMLLHW